MALRGIRVLEFVGLAPGPFCGKILADFGATVTRIEKIIENPIECLQSGKNTLVVNIKKAEAQNFIKSLCKSYDVLIDPFRPGVLEKNNLGPSDLMKENPRLIYARLTGFGQSGPLANRSGHDINYVALSGILSFLGRKGEKPTPPINLLADFASGGLLCAFGICLALLERHHSGKGQIVDNSMVEGSAYIGSWLIASQKLPIWSKPRGENTLDSGAFYYDTYETKDGKFMSVGALEPQFYALFVKTLGLDNLEQYDDNDTAKKLVSERFLTKTQKEWSEIFEKVDACVFPVLDWQDAGGHEHNKFRQSFDKNGLPKPAPRLGRTPGQLADNGQVKDLYEQAVTILKDIGMTEKEIRKLVDIGVIQVNSRNKL